MEKDEEICQFNAKLSNLVNIMRSLGEDTPKFKVVRKVLRSLPKRFRPKVTAIEEIKELKVMKLDELISSLQNFETTIRNLPRRRALPLR